MQMAPRARDTERFSADAMTGPAASRAALAGAVRATVDSSPGRRLVLAISGGRDSMAMLHAFARYAPESIAVVATVDHGTGAHATDAVRLVGRWCAERGVRATSTRIEGTPATEAAWRDARWRFLREVAAAEGAIVATAHTRDDNIETILMRELRGSGARGLAALYAPGDVARPLLELPRAVVASYAEVEGVRWIEDPSNESRAWLRNRIRHDILPALLRVRPSLGDDLLDVARNAAAIRVAMDHVARTLASGMGDGSLSVAAAPLGDYDQEALRALWPAIAARAQIVLDARGTAGLARFTKGSTAGDRMQLSGSIEVLRRRDAIVLRSVQPEAPDPAELREIVEWGRWRFIERPVAPGEDHQGDPWSASLPRTDRLIVRAWRDGDRMHGAGDAAPRRVKRFLRDAGLVGPERRGWPVVVCGEEVVWIPGVRRSDAATVRSGRPEAVYVCERTER
jgi:tRNA(Ile)-lysidine synthase